MLTPATQCKPCKPLCKCWLATQSLSATASASLRRPSADNAHTADNVNSEAANDCEHDCTSTSASACDSEQAVAGENPDGLDCHDDGFPVSGCGFQDPADREFGSTRVNSSREIRTTYDSGPTSSSVASTSQSDLSSLDFLANLSL